MRRKGIRPAAEDFASADFGDKRLGARLEAMAEALAAAPDASLPQAMPDHAALEGAYRFLGNAKVNADRILAPHIEATAQRVRDAGLAYCVSDTTEFRFTGDSRRGLGHLQGGGQGFLEHMAVAVAADGSRFPLGVLAHKTILRSAEPKRRRHTTKSRCAADSESRKWLEVAEASEAVVTRERCLIHLMDREGDVYASLAGLVAAGRRFVVRLGQNRSVQDDDEGVRLFEALRSAEPMTYRDVEASERRRRNKREQRTARVAIAARNMVLRRAKAAASTLPKTLPVHVVHVREVDPPEGEDAIDWKLVTTEPIATAADVERVVDAYRARWVIEEYFKALKTGCDVEKNQLESFKSIHNLLAIMMPIAIQLLALRSLATLAPAAPAQRVLNSAEIRALRLMSRAKLPTHLTAMDAMSAVAAMGGHIKNNGPPGWLVLSRGYLTLLRYAEVIDALDFRGKA